MTDRSPDEIEREIEAERSALERSVDELQAHFSPDALVNQAGQYLRTNGGDVAETAARTIRDNPMAAAITGAGIAWLIAGATSGAKPKTDGETAPGFTSSRPDMAEPDDSFAASDSAFAREAASAPLAPAQQPDTGEEGHIMTTYLEGAPAKDTRSLKDRAASTATRLSDRIDDGTAEMSEAARDRVIRARAAAIAAQDEVERRATNAARYAKRTSQEKPVLVGLLAFAAGAAIGAALPRTQTENRAIGAHRDRLMDEADRVFREETARLRAVADAPVAEGQAVARDTLDRDTETPDAASALHRVSGAARASAVKRHGDMN